MALGTLSVTEYEMEGGRPAESIEGKITTLAMSLRIRLEPIEDRRSDKAPDYTIMGNAAGHWAEVGKAWRKQIERGEHAGGIMFSLLFDDDTVGVRSCAAFPHALREWEIVRERPRQPAPVA